ncbi:MAG TPA: hypothetical protein VKQ73_00690 [Stellaceae bacterium]|nr:hypothetical protein [Stellaceae bacterium]
MSGGQIAALIGAIVLLLPGGGFVLFGATVFPPLALVGVIILGLAVWLFAIAFRKPQPAAAGEASPSPPDAEP